MTTVKRVLEFLDSKAPCEIKMDFDNVGLLVGDESRVVKRLLLALDITDEVVEEAATKKAELIVSHHPLFFSLKSVSTATPQGKRIISMIEKGIAGICMHTNLDAVSGGVNDALAEAAGLIDIKLLEESGVDKAGRTYGIGRIGRLEKEKSLSQYLPFLKNALKTNGLRYYDAGRPVKMVAVGSGSCGEYLVIAAEKGCDTFISADIKYDYFLDAKRMGINAVDADHFCTENVVLPVLEKWLEEAFPAIEIITSEIHCQPIKFF